MFCKMWLTSDVLCCTASILHLCAIALDRFYALHDPIEHARRRTVNFVLGMITLVWLVSCLICLPPLIGWNDWPQVWTSETPCALTAEPGYVVYSALGSFYIPLAIIIFVYYKIFRVIQPLKFFEANVSIFWDFRKPESAWGKELKPQIFKYFPKWVKAMLIKWWPKSCQRRQWLMDIHQGEPVKPGNPVVEANPPF